MAVPRLDLVVRNNADWTGAFTLYNGPGITTPWVNVAAWAAATSYQSSSPQSVVTYNGDLYVANTAAVGAWTSGSSFAAESSYWVKVGDSTTYGATPLDLTGGVLKFEVATLDPSTNEIAYPRRPIIQFTSDGSDGNAAAINIATPTANGNITFAFPKARTSLVLPGLYGYDLNFYKSGNVTPVFYGLIKVSQGANP